jgi:hypothetical protein
MSAARSAILCLEKEKLTRAFTWAVSELHRMQSAQVAAVRNGEDFPFQDQIAAAAERREQAKYAIIAQRQTHGC